MIMTISQGEKHLAALTENNDCRSDPSNAPCKAHKIREQQHTLAYSVDAGKLVYMTTAAIAYGAQLVWACQSRHPAESAAL